MTISEAYVADPIMPMSIKMIVIQERTMVDDPNVFS